ncbi:MAG: hypothetical protein J5I90_01660 [Caldilineales bacterium]|nr:hypothetical protein [Caldilineales bacterium]
MKGIRWSRVLMGILVGVILAVLGMGLLVAVLIAISPAQTIQDVQALPRYSFVSNIMVALACAWGAFVATRSLPSGHLLNGVLIALGVGLLYIVTTPAPPISNILTLLMAILASIFSSRMAQLNPRRRATDADPS